MNRKRTWIGWLALATMALTTLFAFRPEQPEPAPIATVLGFYHGGLETTNQSLLQLEKDAQSWQAGTGNLDQLRNQFIESRVAFKRIEPLLAHLAPEAIKDYINGAPLPHTERKAPNIIIIEPQGYQRLDELIFGEAGEDPEAIARLATRLRKKFADIATDQKRWAVSDRLVLEAARFGVVRIVTLGITGFDTPTSGQSMPEALESLKGIAKQVQPYLHQAETRQPGSSLEVQKFLEGGIRYLQANQDFDTFDRMTFIRDYMDPLYGALLRAHQSLGYETIGETTFRKQSVNYQAESMFGEDFLNAYFFTDLQAKRDNEHVRELGKMLFFDPILSRNNQRACASCHNPDKAFTDGRPKSLATDFKGTVDRNAPTLLNAMYADKYFYDLRAEKPAGQIEQVIHNSKEFDLTYPEIFDRLNKSQEYRELFAEAFPQFGSDPIKRHTLSMAMVSYLRSLVSLDSEVDRYLRQETASIDPKVQNGFNLFMGKAACATCHFAPVFNGSVPPGFQESESEVLGVLQAYDTLNPVLDTDPGRAAAGKLKDESEIYLHSFKTVTVRNVALTAPYWHNGSVKTLEDIVDFYNRGGGMGLGLDIPNQTLPPDALGLSKSEQADLVAFMEALTDTAGTLSVPAKLPAFESRPEWNKRTIGGDY